MRSNKSRKSVQQESLYLTEYSWRAINECFFSIQHHLSRGTPKTKLIQKISLENSPEKVPLKFCLKNQWLLVCNPIKKFFFQRSVSLNLSIFRTTFSWTHMIFFKWEISFSSSSISLDKRFVERLVLIRTRK